LNFLREHNPMEFWKPRIAALVLFGAYSLCFLASAAAESDAALEYKVKAGYLFNFAKFVEWPASALPQGDSPLVIGVIDNGEALPAVQLVLEGKMVGQRPLRIKAVSAEHPGKDLHILFVTRAAKKSPESLRRALGDASILLVGESEEFAERGGTIGYQREGESIRIHLNLERAVAAGLKVSAKLSSVARVVKGAKEDN
jgi:hypothetical protein